MSVINFRRKEIVAKIVYYGPALSGKTTNVKKIHEHVPVAKRGKLMSLATKGDRTLFFDYVPIHLGNIGGFSTKFQIFTVPGQVIYGATRRIVLQGVDGVVFVADSTPGTMEANRRSLEDLRENLLHHGKHMNATPLVMQYNKRDLEETIPIEELEEELNLLSVPSFRASAIQGMGVLPTLSKISSLVLTHLKASIEGRLVHGRSDPSVIQQFTDEGMDDEALVRDLMAQIHRVRAGEVDTDIEIVDEDEEEEEAEEEAVEATDPADDDLAEAATRLIMLPSRESRAQLTEQEEGAPATLTGEGATLVGGPRRTGENLGAAEGSESTATRADATADAPVIPSLPVRDEAVQQEATTGVTDIGAGPTVPIDVRRAGAGSDESASPRPESPGTVEPPAAPAAYTPESEEGAGTGDGTPEDAEEHGDPLARMAFPQEDDGHDLTDYHLAGLKITPPPEQLVDAHAGDDSGARADPPGQPESALESGEHGGSHPSISSVPRNAQDHPSSPGRPPTPRAGTAGPRLVSAPVTSAPRREGLEVVDVGRPVRESGGVWAVPVTVKTAEDAPPTIVVFRATFDDSELPEQPVPVPGYVLAWLVGLSILTLLGLALGLGLL